MTATDITRVKAGDIDKLETRSRAASGDLPSIRNEAAELLGYKKPAKSKDREARGPLYEGLAALDIEILHTPSVLVYMQTKLAETQAAYFQELGLESTLKALNPTTWDQIKWHETALSEYKGQVPEFVLEKAVQIKKAVSEVAFGVLQLDRSQDPFLVAFVGGTYAWDRKEAYVIEVWDEPVFEQRMR